MTPAEAKVRKEQALADSAIFGDEAACAKHGIAPRTLRGYRTAARRDPALAQGSLSKIEAIQRDWLQQTQSDLADISARLREMCSKAKPTPSGIHAVAGAFKILSEASLARIMLEFKLQPQGTTAAIVPRA